jgi:serine/threonine protein kinase
MLLYCTPEVYTEYNSNDHRVHRRKDEKANKSRYSYAVDLWSLGSILFYILCSNLLYPTETETSYKKLLKSIITKPLDIGLLQHIGISEDRISFVRSMLQVRSDGRPTIDQLEASPWLANL